MASVRDLFTTGDNDPEIEPQKWNSSFWHVFVRALVWLLIVGRRLPSSLLWSPRQA